MNTNEFIQECLNELVNIKDPIIQELMIKRISDLTSIDQKNILQVLNEKVRKKSRFKQVRQSSEVKEETKIIIDNKLPLKLYDDIIRLCFSEDKNIRNFIFERLDQSWLKSDYHKEIFDKIYIHLKALEGPPVNIIAEQIESKESRQKLIDLTFDLEKIDPNISMAIDCIIRLEQFIIQESIDKLREKLKDADDNDELDIINQLSNLEQNIFKVKNKYNEE